MHAAWTTAQITMDAVQMLPRSMIGTQRLLRKRSTSSQYASL